MTQATTIPSHQAKTHLAQLLDRVERGEEITISRHGRPIARLAPVGPGHNVLLAKRAVEGLFEGRAKLAASGVTDFDVADIHALLRAGRKY